MYITGKLLWNNLYLIKRNINTSNLIWKSLASKTHQTPYIFDTFSCMFQVIQVWNDIRGSKTNDYTFIFGWTVPLKHRLSWERQTNNMWDSLQLFFIINSLICVVPLSFHPSILHGATFHLFVCLRISHVMSDCKLIQTRNDWSLVSSSSETQYITRWLFSWPDPYFIIFILEFTPKYLL